MSSAAVVAAFSARLTAEYPTIALLDLENEIVKPPTDSSGRLQPFIGLFCTGYEDAQSIGSPDYRCWREVGTANIAIYYPSWAGADTPRSMADAIRGIFRGRVLPVAAPGVMLEVRGVSPLGPYLPRFDRTQGNYYVSAVSAAYVYDFID
jgi:hypothetical protein